MAKNNLVVLEKCFQNEKKINKQRKQVGIAPQLLTALFAFKLSCNVYLKFLYIVKCESALNKQNATKGMYSSVSWKRNLVITFNTFWHFTPQSCNFIKKNVGGLFKLRKYAGIIL